MSNIERIDDRTAIIQTSAGALRVMFHGQGVSHVTTSEAGPENPNRYRATRDDSSLTVNGVEYRGRMDVKNGLGVTYLYMSREWRPGKSDEPSASARAKLKALACDAVAEVLAAFPGLSHGGEAHRISTEAARLDREIDRLRSELAEKERERSELIG